MGDSQDPVDGGGSAEASASARRTRLVLVSIGAAYALSILILAGLDQVGVIWKSLVVPGLALAAALTGRLRAFVRDWAVFLGAVVLFDAGRGFVYGLVTHFDLPVYMHYAIDAEKALFGDPLLTVQVQSLLTPDGKAGWFDRLLAVIYGSHFLAFLFYGLLIWMVREREFGRFKTSILAVMYLGVLCYLAVPTVPPWMAAHVYFVIPPIQEIGGQIFHSALPALTAAFELNPVAAMPSLHCAFPTLLTLITFQHFGRWGIPLALYTCCVYLSTIQLGHHYAVDVLGGIALALVCFLAVYRSDRIARALGALTPPGTTPLALRIRILVTALLLMLTQAESIVAPALTGGPNPLPSAEFIARELKGKSPMANYYSGLRAHQAGRHAEAEVLLRRAIVEVPRTEARESALGTLALSAYSNRHYAAVVDAASKLPALPPGLALIVAESLVRTGQSKAGFDLLESVAKDYPDHNDVELTRTKLQAYRPGS